MPDARSNFSEAAIAPAQLTMAGETSHNAAALEGKLQLCSLAFCIQR